MQTTSPERRELDDIASYLDARNGGDRTVREVLAAKRPVVWTIGPDATVFEALGVMAEKNVGALVVVEGEAVVGVVSERDYARKVILIGKASRRTRVREIMSSPVELVSPEATVGECMRLMTDKFIRHLPVVEHGVLIGCVSIGDVVKAIINDQSLRIGQYEAYVRGAYPA